MVPPSPAVIYLAGGFKAFLFLPPPGEMIQFDYVSNGLKPPTRYSLTNHHVVSLENLPGYQKVIPNHSRCFFWLK